MHFVLAFILWCALLFKDPKELNFKNQTKIFSKGIRQKPNQVIRPGIN
jgi:hypothetical protein